METMLNGAVLINALGANKSSVQLTLLESADSTNNILRKMAEDGAPEGSVVIAAEQSAGRGRRGRSFFSPKGGGLYMSLLLRPKQQIGDVCTITCLAAVTVCEAIERVSGKEAGIKWVNDVLINGKKVCGILTETKLDGAGVRPEYVIVGIGINVCEPENGFPPELKDIAGAVFAQCERYSRETLAAQVINAFFENYSGRDNKVVQEKYIDKNVTVGKRVEVFESGLIKPAKAVSIDEQYRLVVQYDSGEIQALCSGEISVCPEK